MKTARHAAALMLLGWYLMIPPSTNDKQVLWDTEAPLARWRIMHAADTAKECEDYFADFYAHTLAGQPARQRLFVRYAQCVASNDPRLNQK